MTSLISWNWPSDFPQGCPPEQASAADGSYYRIVKNDPPEPDDFVSVYHLNRDRAILEIRRGRRSECETKGLSVFMDRDDAIRCAHQYPKIGNRVATVALTPKSGKTLQTGGISESHHTWWKVADFDPLTTVQVVVSA